MSCRRSGNSWYSVCSGLCSTDWNSLSSLKTTLLGLSQTPSKQHSDHLRMSINSLQTNKQTNKLWVNNNNNKNNNNNNVYGVVVMTEQMQKFTRFIWWIWPTTTVDCVQLRMLLSCRRHLTLSAKTLCFPAVRPSVRSFVRSDLVTTISHERLSISM